MTTVYQRGTVNNICLKLGWEPTQVRTQRSCRSPLSMATLKFRHDFYANQEFPLDVNDQVIRKCAEHFCDDDSTKGVDSFFLKNQEAIDNKYPFLPDDRGL